MNSEKWFSCIGIFIVDGIFFKEVKDIVCLEVKESYINIVFIFG